MCTINNERYQSALKRNANEIGRALLELKALESLEQADTYHGMDFIRLSYDALFNDYIAHAIKVFEDSDVSSFWYLKRCKEKEVLSFCSENNIDLSSFEKVKDALRKIRNKTHFHMDRQYVKECTKAWKDADLKGIDLASALEKVWKIVNYLYNLEFDEYFNLPSYDGKDAMEAAKHVQKYNYNF